MIFFTFILLLRVIFLFLFQQNVNRERCLLHGYIRTIVEKNCDRKNRRQCRIAFKKQSMKFMRNDDDLVFPTMIYLTSNRFSPEWRIGFCENGHAFANLRPLSKYCPSYSLSKDWSLLYFCLPVPPQCRTTECRVEHRCPEICNRSISCLNSFT